MTPYERAYTILMRHAERMGRAEGEVQMQAHLKAGRRRETFGTGRKYPFRPSQTLVTVCKMAGDSTMTPERALAFLHDPAVAAWETERRLRDAG